MITDFFKPPGSRKQPPATSKSAATTTTTSQTAITSNGLSHTVTLPPLRPQHIVVPAFPLSDNTEPCSRKNKLVLPPPYASPILSAPTPHPKVTVQPIQMGHILSLQQMTRALLPVRYSNSHYAETITDTRIASISRAAIYNDQTETFDLNLPLKAHGSDKVVGAIKCTLEPIVSTEVLSTMPVANNLYIETLLLQAPYRRNGIAKSLLDCLLYRPIEPLQDKSNDQALSDEDVSDIVRHYNIRTVSAHVHESNEDALAWYVTRGFTIQPVTIEGYYRKMRPSGAKIAVKALHWKSQPRQPLIPPTENTSDDSPTPRKRLRST